MILPPTVLATIEVMGEVILYRQISFDTAHIKAGSRLNATFFEVSSTPYLDGSAAVTAGAESVS